MLTVTSTVSTWPTEVLKFTYPNFITNRKYQIFPEYNRTLSTNIDGVHGWVSQREDSDYNASIIHNGSFIQETNIPVSAAPAITYIASSPTLSSSLFWPKNDQALLTLRAFAPFNISSTISPEFTGITNLTTLASAKEIILETTSINGGSAIYVIPSHLIYSDSRTPSAINQSGVINLYTSLRRWSSYYYGTKKEELGNHNTAPYEIPAINYTNFTSFPLVTSDVQLADVADLHTFINKPQIYQHIAGLDSLGLITPGTTAYTDNLLTTLDADSLIKRNSVMFKFGYFDPNVTSDKYTSTQIIAATGNGIATYYPSGNNDAIYDIIRNEFKLGYVRDIPNSSILNPVSARLIGRAGVTNEFIVNSSTSYINYETGDFNIELNDGYVFSGLALSPLYYNRLFKEYGGYPDYKLFNVNVIDQESSLYDPVRTIGNSMNASFDVTINDLSSVVDLNDYPSFGSKSVSCIASVPAGSPISYDTDLNFEDISAISFSSVADVPSWLYTYTSVISSDLTPPYKVDPLFKCNGMNLVFDKLSAEVTVVSNSAIIKPLIVSNYGTTVCEFSSRDAYYGYFRLDCPQAISEINSNAVTNSLSVYVLDTDNQVLSSYPVILNSLDMNMPYSLKSYADIQSIELSALKTSIQTESVPLTLQNVAYYYGNTLTDMLSVNRNSIQAYAISNAIKTSHADNNLSFIGSSQVFINKMYQYVNECINPSNKSISDINDIENEIQYKLTACGDIYKSFYEIFNATCRNYVNNAARASGDTIISAENIDLCNNISALLGKLAVTSTESAVGFDIASNLFSIKNIIDSTGDLTSYNFIVDVLTESFILATWPGTFNITNILKQNEITYDIGGFSVIKKVLSLRFERIFNYYTFALSSAKNSGVISDSKYNEIIDYYSKGQYHLFFVEIIAIKSLIDYNVLLEATINKQYTANTNKNTAYYIMKAENDLNKLFADLYAVNSLDAETVYNTLYSSLDLDEYKVMAIIRIGPNQNTLINRTNNEEVFASNSLSDIQIRFDKTYYTSQLLPLSCRFCIVSPNSAAHNASFALNMFTNVIGSTYTDIQNPELGLQTYKAKNINFNKPPLVYKTPSFIINKPEVKGVVGVTFSQPHTNNDIVQSYINIPPGLIPQRELTNATVTWRMDFEDTDVDYISTWLSDTIGTTPFLTAGNYSYYSTAFATTAIGSNITATQTNPSIVYNYNNVASLYKIGVNPITVSVSVSSDYLSRYASPYIANNMLTGVGVFIPDLGQLNTIYSFDSALTSAYNTGSITSHLSVISADYARIDNPILLRNYFVKNNRVYNPPTDETIMFNIESVYGASKLYRLDSLSATETAVPKNTYIKNAPYFKVKTIMPKTLSTFTPATDRLKITTYSTPNSIIDAPLLSSSLNFYPHHSNLYSKFGFTITATDGVSSISSIGSNTTTDLLIALTARPDAYAITMEPLSSPYMEFAWSVSAAATSAYSVDNSILTISSFGLSAFENNIAAVTLSARFNYLDGATKAVSISDPFYIYTSSQVISSLSAQAWTVNHFDLNGVSAVNDLDNRLVNTSLTSIGDGHTETIVFSTIGTPFEKYAWVVGDSIPFVSSTPSASAFIQGIEGDSLTIRVSGFEMIYDTDPILDSLSALYDPTKVITINPNVSASIVIENDNHFLTTEASSVTSSYFKSLDFIPLNTPSISASIIDTTVYFTSAIDIGYSIIASLSNTSNGEILLSGNTVVYGTLIDNVTDTVKTISPTTFTFTSGLSTDAVTLDTLIDFDLFNCAILSLTSDDTVYTTVSGSDSILHATSATRIHTLTAVKLPELNIFWDNAYYPVGESLIIKNNNDFSSCYGMNIGFDSLSVKFNDEIQIVPASATTITFDNLNDIGIYSIEISGSTLSALSASYPIITKTFDNAITVVESFDTFNEDARVLNETLKLPYDLNSLFISPGDYIVADNINASLKKLYSNYTYLKNKAKYNDTKLPVEFNKWLGTTTSSFDKWRYVTAEQWAVVFNTIIPGAFDNIIGFKIYNNYLVVVNRPAPGSDRLVVYDFDLLSADLGIKSSIIGEDKFDTISALDIDSDGNIYVVDSGADSVYMFSLSVNNGYASLSLVKKIGGVGNATRPYRFKNPIDIHISLNGNICIVDKENDVVKVYNDKLTHLFNVAHTDWILQSDLVSVSSDVNGNIFVLRATGVIYKFTSGGSFISVITDIPNTFNGDPVCVHCNSIDNGILYIVYSTHVSKITTSGIYLGYFRPIHHPYVNKLTSIAQFNRNILIGDTHSIYNTVDFISLKSIMNDIDSIDWKLADILIDPDDLVQDWVYNTAFSRLRDNFEMYSANLHSKYIFNINIDGKVVAEVIPMPDAELPVFDFTQCLIGQNELVFADVINRVIKQLYENQLLLLTSIESSVNTNMCADNWCWSWSSLGSIDPIKKNCSVNPISFIELRSNSPGIGGRTWTQLTNTTTCCEIISA